MSVKFNCVGFVDRRTDDLKARYDLIESARIPQIEVRPIQRPIYNSIRMDYARWLENNLQTLADYFNDLISADGAGPLGEDDFFLFTRVQHDSERDRMEELRRCYKSYGDSR